MNSNQCSFVSLDRLEAASFGQACPFPTICFRQHHATPVSGSEACNPHPLASVFGATIAFNRTTFTALRFLPGALPVGASFWPSSARHEVLEPGAGGGFRSNRGAQSRGPTSRANANLNPKHVSVWSKPQTLNAELGILPCSRWVQKALDGVAVV